MKHRIITISREFGSGGRTIGRMTAEELHIPCYDEELIDTIVQKSGFDKEYVKEYGEYAPGSNWLSLALANRDYSGRSLQDDLWSIQRSIILDLAEKGPCVIVGRCADYILRDTADCLKVFIHASMEKRAQRIVSVYGEREDAPETRLRKKDKSRRAYYQYYTDTAWGDIRSYHVALDSGVLGIEACVRIIRQLYENNLS